MKRAETKAERRTVRGTRIHSEPTDMETKKDNELDAESFGSKAA